MTENEITEKLTDCTIKVHQNTKAGLLESAYQECSLPELKIAGLKVQKEKPLPPIFKKAKLDCGYWLNLLVEDIVEIKYVEALNNIHLALVLTDLKLNKSKIRLLINFEVIQLVSGVKRIINKYKK